MISSQFSSAGVAVSSWYRAVNSRTVSDWLRLEAELQWRPAALRTVADNVAAMLRVTSWWRVTRCSRRRWELLLMPSSVTLPATTRNTSRSMRPHKLAAASTAGVFDLLVAFRSDFCVRVWVKVRRSMDGKRHQSLPIRRGVLGMYKCKPYFSRAKINYKIPATAVVVQVRQCRRVSHATITATRKSTDIWTKMWPSRIIRF